MGQTDICIDESKGGNICLINDNSCEDIKKIISDFVEQFYLCIENTEGLDKFICIQQNAEEIIKWCKFSIAAYVITKEQQIEINEPTKENTYHKYEKLSKEDIKYCITTLKSKISRTPDNNSDKEDIKVGTIVKLANNGKEKKGDWYKLDTPIGDKLWINNIVLDLSPVCTNFMDIINEDNGAFARIIASLNIKKDSHRSFDELHFHTDPNLTIGFGHFANSNLNPFFEKMKNKKYSFGEETPETTKNILTSFFASKLTELSDDNFFYKQILSDPIFNKEYNNNYAIITNDLNIKKVLDTNIEKLKELSFNDWREFIDSFLFNHILQLKEGTTKLKRKKNGMNFWIDQIESYFTSLNEDEFFPKEYKNNREKFKYTDKKINYSTNLIKLFPGKGQKTGFWFNDILMEALTLVSLCNYQVDYFRSHFYDTPKKWAKQIIGQNVSTSKLEGLIATLTSCKSTGIGNITRNFYKKNDENITNIIYDSGNFKVKNYNSKEQKPIGQEVPKEFDFENPDMVALLFWHSYNIFKEEIRSRQEAIWNIWLSNTINPLNNKKTMPPYNIKFSDLKDYISNNKK